MIDLDIAAVFTDAAKAAAGMKLIAEQFVEFEVEVLSQQVRGTTCILRTRAKTDWFLEAIVIFDLRDSLQITDYFVIASGLNPRHLKSSCDLLDRRIREQGVRRHGMEGYREGTWILVDYDTVVVHLFLEGQRRLYDLELLWGDSPRLEWTPLPSTG